MTIANMAIEAGGKNGIFEFDAQTQASVDYRCKLNGTKATYEPVERDKRREIRLRTGGGSCRSWNRRSRAIRIPASASWRRKWATSSWTGLTSVPARAARRAISWSSRACCGASGWRLTPLACRRRRRSCMICRRRAGATRPSGRFSLDAGVQMTENAGCAACLGGPVDTFGRMNAPLKCISATNRNFPGPHGPQGIAGVSRVAGHGGGERADGQDHRPAGILELIERGHGRSGLQAEGQKFGRLRGRLDRLVRAGHPRPGAGYPGLWPAGDRARRARWPSW